MTTNQPQPINHYEQQFLTALKNVFIGAKVEGESGYINLMRIKAQYFEQGIFPQLMDEIQTVCQPFDPTFREELFDKLYDFFSRYFSESGSIYFRHTAPHQNIYERVYTDDRDVMLFWKTQMLYYVKTDRLFKSLELELDGQRFFFDVSQMELKRANEKRALIYEWQERDKTGRLVLRVSYSERGSKTKTEELLKAAKEAKVALSEETLEKACRVFEKQSEVDFFINKNAQAFLQEQFDLWLYQYLFKGESHFSAPRVAQLQAIKKMAYHIIDFIAQFEDELVRIWNKPKFVLNSHYVLTLDKMETHPALLQKIFHHAGIHPQYQEWQQLGMLPADAPTSAEGLYEAIGLRDLAGSPVYARYQFLPLDTRYFPDLELEILSLFDDLDAALDGWLIHSENYQALNTLLPKFQNRVQAIYIDPPFNLDSTDQFAYRTNYKNANWATLLENRLHFAKQYLNELGIIFVRCDYNGNWLVRCLLDAQFGEDSFYNEIFVNRIKKNVTDKGKRNIPAQIDSLFAYRKSREAEYINILKKLGEKREAYWHAMDSAGIPGPRHIIIEGETYYPPEGRHFTFPQKQVDEMYVQGRIRVNPKTGKPQYLVLEKDVEHLDTNWTDIPGYAFLTGFQTENSEVLVQRVLEVTSHPTDLVMDFFVGSGTTAAVAHKLGRKWLGVEMGQHFYTVVLPRMKSVLYGDQSGVSKDVYWRGGGFFKYFDLEQYEDSLRRAHYADAPLLLTAGNIYSRYIFLRDLKFLETVALNMPDNRVEVDVQRLYAGIDLAETLSCITGKWIKRITADIVEFQDGSTVNLHQPDWQTIKPLIWW